MKALIGLAAFAALGASSVFASSSLPAQDMYPTVHMCSNFQDLAHYPALDEYKGRYIVNVVLRFDSYGNETDPLTPIMYVEMEGRIAASCIDINGNAIFLYRNLKGDEPSDLSYQLSQYIAGAPTSFYDHDFHPERRNIGSTNSDLIQMVESAVHMDEIIGREVARTYPEERSTLPSGLSYFSRKDNEVNLIRFSIGIPPKP